MVPSSCICAVLRLYSGSYPCQILHSLSWRRKESDVYTGADSRGACGVAVSRCRLRARSLRAGASPCGPGGQAEPARVGSGHWASLGQQYSLEAPGSRIHFTNCILFWCKSYQDFAVM